MQAERCSEEEVVRGSDTRGNSQRATATKTHLASHANITISYSNTILLSNSWIYSLVRSTMEELQDIVAEEWKETDKEYLRSLARSMPKRCQAVIDAKGDHTKY